MEGRKKVRSNLDTASLRLGLPRRDSPFPKPFRHEIECEGTCDTNTFALECARRKKCQEGVKNVAAPHPRLVSWRPRNPLTKHTTHQAIALNQLQQRKVPNLRQRKAVRPLEEGLHHPRPPRSRPTLHDRALPLRPPNIVHLDPRLRIRRRVEGAREASEEVATQRSVDEG